MLVLNRWNSSLVLYHVFSGLRTILNWHRSLWFCWSFETLLLGSEFFIEKLTCILELLCSLQNLRNRQLKTRVRKHECLYQIKSLVYKSYKINSLVQKSFQIKSLVYKSSNQRLMCKLRQMNILVCKTNLKSYIWSNSDQKSFIESKSNPISYL